MLLYGAYLQPVLGVDPATNQLHSIDILDTN